MEPTVPTLADAPPDWAATTDRVACPLCGYDLRGLAEPRCPECGFAFGWAELLDRQRTLHPYLFEHHPERNIRSFWRTYAATCRPRRFWRELNPAQPVRTRRLVAYALIAAVVLLGVPVVSLAGEAWATARQYSRQRALFRPGPAPGLWVRWGPVGFRWPPMSTAQLDQYLPRVATRRFARRVWGDHWGRRGAGTTLVAAAVAAGWPWVTFAALLVFQTSMRRATVDRRHVLRAAVYGCDFGLLVVAGLGVVLAAVAASDGPLGRELPPQLAMTAVLVGCPIIAAYRLSWAYRRYLRFHMAVPTVIASQAIAWLAVMATLGVTRVI